MEPSQEPTENSVAPLAPNALAALESDWHAWLCYFFPHIFCESDGTPRPLAPAHRRWWQWVWSIEAGTRARPYCAGWPRGYGKSTGAELAVIAWGARKARRYVLYTSGTQPRANEHIHSIAAELGRNARLRANYPALCRRRVDQYSHSEGWRGDRLVSDGGLVVDGLGLTVQVRGIKFEDQRPDARVFDDIDEKDDTLEATAKKRNIITTAILPAGSLDAITAFIQNIITASGVAAELFGISEHQADYLTDRIIDGPIPAIEGLTYEATTQEMDGVARLRYVLTDGEPTWERMGLQACQALVDEEGITAFLQECQHNVEAPPGGMFDHLPFESLRITWEKLSEMWQRMVRVVAWCDPAVTNKEHSDSHGIVVMAVDDAGIIYILWGWEQRATPMQAISKALEKGMLFGASHVGIETDQGGDTWGIVYEAAIKKLKLDAAPPMAEAKAGQSEMTKVGRASKVLADFEMGGIRIVVGAHEIVERALKRFPRTKPLDLVDTLYYGWADLRNQLRWATGPAVMEVGTEDDEDEGGDESVSEMMRRRRRERMGVV